MFRDRAHAGMALAHALEQYRNVKNAIILALPRGGVVVGAEVARELRLPLDLVVPRKIGAPDNPEYAIGAITETGEGIMNKEETSRVDPDWLKTEMKAQQKEAERRLRTYRGDRPAFNLKGKIAIIVDDGVATGFTMRAAIASVRARHPVKVVIAVPHGARDSMKFLRSEADEVIVLDEPAFYGAVGAFYESFPQVEDEEVIAIMKRFSP